MKILKTLSVAVLAIASMSMALPIRAALVDVGPGATFFFNEFHLIDDNADITGFGLVNTIRNEAGIATYSSSLDNQLTYEFGATFSSRDVANGTSEYTDTFMNFYYDTGNSFDPVTGGGITDGVLALDLTGRDFVSGVTGDTVDLAGISILNFGFLAALMDVGNGAGFLNDQLNTNTLNGGDLDFTASFSDLNSDFFAGTHTGTSDLRGFVEPVPEPMTLALLGMGIIGLGVKRQYS